MELRSREEMDPRFMWDLTCIFASKEEWETAYGEAEHLIENIGRFKGTMGAGAEALKAALDGWAELMQKTELVCLYAELQLASDNSNPEYQSMQARCTALAAEGSAAMAYIMPELMEIPGEKLAEYMKAPGMAVYGHTVEDMCRGRAHVLDEKREEMLAMLQDAAQTPENAFTMLQSVDMTFPPITDENGNEAPLTHGSFGKHRESADPRVRRESFEKYFGEFNRYINTIAALYAGSVKLDCFSASVRGYDSACHEALFQSNVPVAVLDSLTEAVHSRLDIMKKYLAVRKRVLGLDELHMYDLYCPIVKNADFPIDFESSKALVKKALEPLGDEYQALLDKAYAENWMDVYENRGKTTGAFSCGVYGVHPFVLLNFNGTLDSAFTMAHELGHAMHSYKSDSAQDYVNHDYKILVAEVASTVNEVLLTMYLLKTEKDKGRRAYVLNHFLEGFRTTVFRQTLFAEFERRAHEMEEAGEPLTATSLTALYRKLNELYYNGATVDEIQCIEWARIPHFYNAFYVYQYATGFCSAVAIARRIIETGDPSDYLKFLCSGGSDYPLEELKIAGVDLTNPESVLSALDVFDDTLNEFESLIKEI